MQTTLSLPPSQLSCIVGNLFATVEPPCQSRLTDDALVIYGTTYTGNRGRLVIRKDSCTFQGDLDDIHAIRKTACLERSCFK